MKSRHHKSKYRYWKAFDRIAETNEKKGCMKKTMKRTNESTWQCAEDPSWNMVCLESFTDRGEHIGLLRHGDEFRANASVKIAAYEDKTFFPLDEGEYSRQEEPDYPFECLALRLGLLWAVDAGIVPEIEFEMEEQREKA